MVSRYLKSGSSKNLSNYVKYIATREGAATVKENNGTVPATKKQQELISSLLKDFSYSKNSFSYEEYQNSPTQKNASKFIEETIEHNADIVANKKNYMGYLANRPGAVKFGSHGLFSQTDEPISLHNVAKEVSEHKGNVWTHVVSLRRDDAQKIGYDNLNAWRELIKRQIPNIAKQSKIDMANLKWYAAFHDKETNPHVHIVVYSTNEREGFLTKQGCDKIRSDFMNDIYADELKHLYQQQTDTRDLLKAESAKLMKKLSSDITDNSCIDTEIVDLMQKLHEQLRNTKGKKVYGYLNKDTKQTVDKIFLRLSQNESIHKMYKLWCDMEQSKHDFYSSAKVEFPAMVDNEHFKSVKNMIIRSAAEIVPVVTVAVRKAAAEDKHDDIAAESDNSEVISKAAALPVASNDNSSFACAAFGLMVNISRIIYDDYDREQRKLRSKVDKKLRKAIDRKKQEMGIKSEYGHSY